MVMKPDCPHPDLLGRFYLKETEYSEWSEVVGHVSDCALCRRTLVLLAESVERPWSAEEIRETREFSALRPSLPGFLKLVAAIAVVAVGIWASSYAKSPTFPSPPYIAAMPKVPDPRAKAATDTQEQLRTAPDVTSPAPAAAADAKSPVEQPEAAPPKDPVSPLAAAPILPVQGPGDSSSSESAGTPSRDPDPSPGAPLPKRLAAIPQQEPTDRQEYSPPTRSSLLESLDRHFSSAAWNDYVWEDYLATPEVLLPVGLALSAVAISHWDRPLERRWEGALGGHSSVSDIGELSLVGAVVLVGVLFPGMDRNGTDEAWTIGETFAAASLTAIALKSGVKRSAPGGPPGSHDHEHSFGSFHSTSAFAASELLERNSGPLVGLPAFGLAAITAFSRVAEGKRYPSDVLAGAAIGTLSAGIFDSLHWGNGNSGGIARPSMKVALDTDALKECKLTITLTF
jgi:membrane-associated phospholipid phosphatase